MIDGRAHRSPSLSDSEALALTSRVHRAMEEQRARAVAAATRIPGPASGGPVPWGGHGGMERDEAPSEELSPHSSEFQSINLWVQSMHSSSSEYRLERAVKMKGDGEALQATPRLYFLGRPPEDLPALASQGFAHTDQPLILGDTLDVANRYFALGTPQPPPGCLVRWRAMVVSVDLAVAGPLDALDMCLDQRQVLECAEEVNDALVAAVGQGRGARLPVGSTSCLLGLPRRAHHAVVPVYLLEYTFRYPSA